MKHLALYDDGTPVVDTHGSALVFRDAADAATYGRPMPLTDYRPAATPSGWAGVPQPRTT